jgi:hypothetical protein
MRGCVKYIIAQICVVVELWIASLPKGLSFKKSAASVVDEKVRSGRRWTSAAGKTGNGLISSGDFTTLRKGAFEGTRRTLLLVFVQSAKKLLNIKRETLFYL